MPFPVGETQICIIKAKEGFLTLPVQFSADGTISPHIQDISVFGSLDELLVFLKRFLYGEKP